MPKIEKKNIKIPKIANIIQMAHITSKMFEKKILKIINFFLRIDRETEKCV